MGSNHIPIMGDWPTPESVWEVQVLLGFTNFHWRISRKYANVTMPKSDLLKKAKNSRMSKLVKW